MAQRQEEFVVKFRVEGDTAVVDSFNKVSQASEHVHTQTRRVADAYGDLRLKAEARVAHNIGEIAQAMTSGGSAADSLAKSLFAVGESFRGNLIFAGAVTAGFAIEEGISRAATAVVEFDRDIQLLKSRTLPTGDFLGTDQIEKNITDASTAFTAFVTKLRSEERGGAIGGVQHLERILSQAAADVLTGNFGDLFKNLNTRDQERLNDLRISGAQALDQYNAKLQDTFDIQEKSLNQSQLAIALQKIDIEDKERRGKVTAIEGLLGIGRSEAETQVNNIRNLQIAQAEKAATFEQQQALAGVRVADIQQQQLAPAEQQLRILEAQIVARQNILDLAHNLQPEEKIQLNTEIASLEAQRERIRLVRQYQADLANIHLAGVEGRLAPGEAQAAADTRRYEEAVRQGGPGSPEAREARAQRQESAYQRYRRYQRDPNAYRREQQQEQFERESYESRRRDYWNNPYAVHTPTMDELYGGGPDKGDEKKEGAAEGGPLEKQVSDLVQALTKLGTILGVTESASGTGASQNQNA